MAQAASPLTRAKLSELDGQRFGEPAAIEGLPGDRPRFDRIARLYRWMEYLSFGPWLQRCRFAHLTELASSQPTRGRAVVYGDGDGRFLARLLASNPALHADAVDLSPAMLRLLRGRVRHAGAQSRLTAICADARIFTPRAGEYDLVVTHFFLDCLTGADMAGLIGRLRPHLAPGALWVISEFQVPAGSRLRAGCARALIASLYAAFRLLTGLRVRHIPPWRSLLAQAGFALRGRKRLLGGLLVSELWVSRQPPSCKGFPT